MTRLIFFPVILCLFVVNILQAQPEPKLLAITFHADWCKSCKKMGSTYEDLKVSMADQPVEFVLLDFTNKDTQKKAKEWISKHNLYSTINKHVGTGFILIIDHQTKRAKAKFNHRQTVDEMEEAIQKFLSS